MNMNILNLSSEIREFVPTDFVLQDDNFINCIFEKPHALRELRLYSHLGGLKIRI